MFFIGHLFFSLIFICRFGIKLKCWFRLKQFLEVNKNFCRIQILSRATNFNEFKTYPSTQDYFKPMIDSYIQLVKSFPRLKILFPTGLGGRGMVLSQRFAKMIEINQDHFATDLTFCWNGKTKAEVFSYLTSRPQDRSCESGITKADQVKFVNQDYMGMANYGKSVNT